VGGFTWSASGLPPGLGVNDSTIVGTPTTAGDFAVTVTATDDDGRTGTKTLGLKVHPSLVATPISEVTAAGRVTGSLAGTQAAGDGLVETITEVSSGGKPRDRYDLVDHTWTVPVPVGSVTLKVVGSWIDAGDRDTGATVEWSDGTTWTLLGTLTDDPTTLTSNPFVPGVTEILVRVTDNDRTSGQNSNDSVAIDLIELTGDGVVPPPAITTTSLPTAVVGSAYSAELSASGGTTPYTWAVTEGSSLPNGLTLGTSGTISGTPIATGGFTFFVTVTDFDGATASKELSISVVTSQAMTATIVTSTTGGRDKYGVATVTVTDGSGAAVAGASVTISWTGDFSGDQDQTLSTGSDGTVTFTTTTTQRRPSFSACVVSVTRVSYTYLPGGEAC
ncbi:MAG TPA: Ig domain-containing protein, partial [Ilumatobacter sp.]